MAQADEVAGAAGGLAGPARPRLPRRPRPARPPRRSRPGTGLDVERARRRARDLVGDLDGRDDHAGPRHVRRACSGRGGPATRRAAAGRRVRGRPARPLPARTSRGPLAGVQTAPSCWSATARRSGSRMSALLAGRDGETTGTGHLVPNTGRVVLRADPDGMDAGAAGDPDAGVRRLRTARAAQPQPSSCRRSVVDAEVVGDLVHDGDRDLVDHLVLVSQMRSIGVPVDRDPVRQRGRRSRGRAR